MHFSTTRPLLWMSLIRFHLLNGSYDAIASLDTRLLRLFIFVESRESFECERMGA